MGITRLVFLARGQEMNKRTEINIASLKIAENLLTNTGQSPEGDLKNNPEIAKHLFQFKQTFLRLLKEGFNHVVITNKTKKTSATTPYYEIIVNKNHLTIKDRVEDSIKLTLIYKWDTLNVTIDGQQGNLKSLSPYFKKMIADMDSHNVELFDER